MQRNIKYLAFIIIFGILGLVSYKLFENDFKLPGLSDEKVVEDEWINYKNSKWGYSLSYPSKLLRYCNTHKTDNVAAFFNKAVYDECPKELTQNTISQFNLVVMDRLEASDQDAALVNIEELYIGNKVGSLVEYQVDPSISVVEENTYYLAELPLGDEHKLSIIWLSANRPLFEAILATLQFDQSAAGSETTGAE